MALNPVKPLYSASATATNGSVTVTVTGGVNCSFLSSGSIVSIGTRQLVDAIAGTAPDINGDSTITLRRPWADPTTTGPLLAFMSYEGLADAVVRLRQIIDASEGNLAGAFSFMGDWNASPGDFPTAPGENLGSQMYRISVAGTMGGRFYRVGEAIYYDQYTSQWRPILEAVTAAAFTNLTSSATDNTAGRLTKVGDGGILGLLDLRGSIFSTGLPQDFYSKGTLFGFADAGELNIPGFSAGSYGFLEVHGQWSDGSGGTGSAHRKFTINNETYKQARVNDTTWTGWRKDITQQESGLVSWFGSLGLNATSAVSGAYQEVSFAAGIYSKCAIRGYSVSTLDAGELRFYTAPDGDLMQERFRIDSAGDLLKYGSVSGALGQTNLDSLRGIKMVGTVANASTAVIGYSDGGGGGAAISFARGNSFDTFLSFSTNAPTNAVPNGMTERMRITSGGDVGIGVINPAYKLDVDAGGAVAARIGGILLGQNGTDIISQTGILSLQATGANMLQLATNGLERMRVSSDGKLNSPGGSAFIGTVSNVGQGAIIERGSNANGEYVRFADGTQICTFIRTGALGMGAYGSETFFVGSFIWFYPAAFVTTPSISGSGTDNISVGWFSASSINSSQVTANYFSRASSNADTLIPVIAIGRWY